MKKNILMLGANGFIGNALVEKLTNNLDFKVYGMDLNDNKLDKSLSRTNFKFLEGDININRQYIHTDKSQ